MWQVCMIHVVSIQQVTNMCRTERHRGAALTLIYLLSTIYLETEVYIWNVTLWET